MNWGKYILITICLCMANTMPANAKAARDLNLTPLHIATYRGNTILMRQILEHSTDDLNAKAEQDITPLHIAANENRIHAVKMLLDYGADTHAKDSNGRTALTIARNKGHHVIIAILTPYSQKRQTEDNATGSTNQERN